MEFLTQDIQVLFIIPCFNEEFRLKTEAFLQFEKENTNVHFLFVDDGSKDGTAKVIKDLSNKMKQANALVLDTNVGKAEAIRSGILFNKEKLKNFQFIGYLDADLSVPLGEIPDFLNILQKNSTVKFIMGARIARLGANIKRIRTRHYLGRIFATLVSILLKEPVYDTQCGIKLIHSSVVFELFKDEFISKWLFDVELLFRWKVIFPTKTNIDTIYEQPLRKWTDVPGSKLNLINFLYAPIELFIIWKKYRKPAK